MLIAVYIFFPQLLFHAMEKGVSELLIPLTLIVMEVSVTVVELRCATMDHMAQSVMWVGMMKMPV